MAQFVTSLQPSLADMSRTPHAGHPPHPHPPPHKGHGHEKEKEKIAQKMAKEQQQLQQQQQQAHSKHAAQAAAAASVPERVAEKSDGNTAFLRAARAGNLDKVLEHLKSDVDINTANANGLNALHLASKEGHTHVVTELLSRGATVDASTKKGNTALHIASLAGQEEVVRLLVQHGAAVNVQSQNGFTPLYMAAQENHDNVVKFLLANGANQSLATEDGFTPLAVAMQQGHDKVVAVLLENDTRGKVRLPALHIAAKKDDCKAAALLLQNEHNPDVTSKSGFTPLHIAAHYGNEAIANLLLNKGADVNYSAKHNISPLHVAAKWGKTNLVALLLERGAHIEAKTRDGLTPLHCAARSGHEQVVDMMLERGAPISCKTKNGLAPLHMAAQGDHVDAARILLYHRAPVDEITVDYLTALHVAAHCGHVRVAKLLLDRKADPNARALNGFTPLHIACKKNRIKVVELLLKHGASIEATTESGLTPLHVASFMGCMNIVIYLLQNEANPDVPTVRGETPLHLAARANQTDIIRILLRNGAQVDARAREQQTPLHIASRLGNVDIVMLLLQHGAAVDSTTKDLYTALHIAAKEGQEEVAAVLLENGASLTATTNKGCTPLHLAAKYGNMKVAKLLLQKDAPVDSQGKNGVTPLHVASHYDHQSVALLLLDKGASPHATAKNGHTPLHIAARKNQMDIATTLLEYGAKANAESRAGFTPLHLSAQEGHTDMSTLLIEHQADTNHQAKNGLTPLHLCAQEDRVNVAQILVKSGANVDSITKAGYTPLHVASHFGQVNMVRFLLQHGADTGAVTSVGYTPLHQAAQQGHSGVVSILLNSGAQPNVTTKQGQTALSIAQKLGYISVVETLKVVTEITTITTTTTTTIEEKYRVVAPETMQETFMSDSEEEGGDQGLECTGMYFGKPTHAQHVYLPYYEGQSLLKREDTLLNEQPYHYLTVDEMKSLGDDSLPIDVTQDDRHDSNRDLVSPQHVKEVYSAQLNYASDNVDISRHPVNVGKLKWKNFLVSFLVDARGGAMRGCRHSGVRVIVPPRKAPQPLRVTCRYLKRDKLSHPPPLMEGEALASRILELGPVGAKFLGPVIIEVPHFGSLRGREREIVILRSDNGETWREHTVEASEDAIHDVLNESFEKDGERNELSQLEVCDSGRLTRILTTDFPQYFAVVSRVRQEVHAIGPEGGMVSSSVVPQVQAVFPQGALTKKIKVGLQAQPIQADLVAKLLGNRVAVSPIVTVEPRRRKFHKPITLTIPVPQAANKGMINQYSGDAPTLRLLCSITGGTTRAQWEDVTGSTPLTFVNDCVSFTTTVSARFWLMDCRNISEATRMATELYKEAIHVPFLAKFVVFSKRVDFLEARLRVFCMTDDKEDKTLEHQEHFTEVAKSRDVEVLEGKSQFVEFAGNLVPVTKSGDQLQLGFRGFRENRLAFTTRVKDPHADAVGRILFMKEAKVQKGDPPQQPVCVLNIVLPDDIIPESSTAESTPQKYSHVHLSINGSSAPARPELRLSDISNTLGSDWESLAVELGLSRSDVDRIKSDHPASAAPQHAMAMLRLWLQKLGNKASGTELQQALQRLGRDDIIHRCMISCDDQEMNLTSSHLGLDQSGFDNLQEELGVSRDVSRDASREASLRRNLSLEAGGPYDEQDIMKVSRDSESVEELVEKPIHTIERIEEVKQIDKHHREQDDSEERKYVAEEKEVEEKRKSVRERTQDIEKRLSQTSMEDQQQRRDSQLFQGVSEGLERLNVTQATEAGGEHNWHESKVSTTTTITSEQHSGSQDRDHSSDVASPQLEDRTTRQFSDGLGGGRIGSEVPPPSSCPHPTPRLQTADKDDDPDSEPAIQENIKSYSERRAFWEQVASSGSAETPTESVLSPTQVVASQHEEIEIVNVEIAPVPVPRHSQRNESVDSEADYLTKRGQNLGEENNAFVNDDETCAPKRPTRMHSVEEYGDKPPPVAVRKALYERSISLPCTDEPATNKRKKQFEDHVRKELVAENLLSQLEEEAVPEHKELPHRGPSDDLGDSIFSDETSETDLGLDRPSAACLSHTLDKDEAVDNVMRDAAVALVEETVSNAEAMVHKAEQHVIQYPEEEVIEWHEVRDSKNNFDTPQNYNKKIRDFSDDDKTNTELRRESLARTHEVSSSRLAEVMQYKGETICKPSDSLEVHVDKSETEDTEKSRDLDEDIRELENQRRAESRVSSADSKGARGPGDHQSQSSSEDTQCESDVTPEDHPDQSEGHLLYQPQQNIQDIVWEVGVQDQPDPLAEEFVHDILVPSGQIILQNGEIEECQQHTSHTVNTIPTHITEEEARKVAEELVQDIEEEVSKRQIEVPIIDTIRQIAEEKKLEDREIELMESILAKKQRDQSHLFSRTDTTTSSMEITDEDLRSSGVEIDLSPTESQSGLYQCMDPRARQEDEKPEALRSEDIDLSDLKPDPIQIDDTTNEKLQKNFSIIEESDECDTRSDHSEVRADLTRKGKYDVESLDELQQSLNAVNEELEEELVIKDFPSDALGCYNISESQEPPLECNNMSPAQCVPRGSPTGSTTSSGGKRTPPPKPERKSKESTGARDGSPPGVPTSEKAVDRLNEHIAIRAESIESQKSSSQDDKSPLSSGETSKDMVDTQNVVRRHQSRPDGESSSSGERSSGALYPDRRSGADFDPYSSSSESHYHSFEQSYSRPCSSDVEGLLAVTTGSSEYESALASARSMTSTDYQTAVSSLSSRESMKSLDSESSGHLASVEVSSEASETLVPSGADLDDMDDSINIVLDDDLERRCDLSFQERNRAGVLSQEVSCVAKYPSADVSDDDAEDTRDQIETDEEDEIPHIMKRSHEMTFNQERKEQSSCPDDKLASSMDGDTGSVLSMSISSASETIAVKTVVELSRTDSDKMDASATSEQLTVSATSQEMSISSEFKEDAEDNIVSLLPKTVDSETSTPTHQRDSNVSSVTLLTSTVDENGIQSASTQVTSESTCVPHELPRRSHRRNESTSNFSQFIPPKSLPEHVSNPLKESHAPESDGYYEEHRTSPTDGTFSSKKDLEESYQTEADQAFHREAREGRYLSDDVEPELEQLDGSRPQSQVSKSDSESGHRAVSSGFSDERADSELAEVLRQGSSDTACEDIIERPLTPEPAEEIQIKPDLTEFSSEALASVSELDMEYSQAHAFSRTVEYASHVSPLKDKPCVAWEHPGEHEDEMAEAEAAFHMVPHHSPHHGVHHHQPNLPETIIEDEDAEQSELEAREAALKEQVRRREEHMRSISPANIPDITVTQHMAPIIDKEFQYPDLEQDDEQAIVESAMSSRESTTVSETTTDSSQGREYVLDDSLMTQSEGSTVLDQTCKEVKSKNSEIDSVTESPTSESFEMLEKPDEAHSKQDFSEDFVIIEEIGKEAKESDTEGKGVRIASASIPMKRREPEHDDEEFIAQSPPPPVTRKMDVKYYGEGGMLDEDDPFRFDVAHDTDQSAGDDEIENEAEVEAGKKWIEMQFGVEEPAAVTAGYNYEMEFERGPLEDIKEEDEMGTSSKIGSVGSQKESVGSFGSGSVKESLSSTPEYDVLAGKKYFTRSGEHDDISMSSLQEFESLEHQLALDSAHKRMIGSQDSLNGLPKKRIAGDDISLASLQEFEKMEKACVEAERIEIRARVEEAMLSEIDEGHESQVSDSDETISGAAMKTIGDSDSDDYDKRMFEIDEIIRQAQSNVERFDEPPRCSGGDPESFGRGDSLEEVARVPDLDYDAPMSLITSTDSLEIRKLSDSMVTSSDSLDVNVNQSQHMITSADSIELQQQLKNPMKADIMTDSIELPTDPSHMITSSDSLELETTLERGDAEDEEASLAGRGSLKSGTGSLCDRSSSSGRDGDLSSSSAFGACGGGRIDPSMLGSTDSLEPSSSTATHATYQYETDSNMSSSFTSGGSNTMMSSTETLEASASIPPEGVWFEETFVEGGSFIHETVEPSDDPEYSHVIKRIVQSSPEIRKVTFRGPTSEAALKDYIERFGAGDQSYETQQTGPDGSVHTSRVVQHRVVMRDDVLRTDLTGPELEDYLKLHGMNETDLTNILSSSSSSQAEVPGPGAIVATTQHRLTASHLTGMGATEGTNPSAAPTSALPRRPPPSHDISVDDEPEFDVREHDWRFNLQHSAEAPEEEEVSSAEEKQ
ncbi:ankyrin-2 isoform X23 [Frankliniella occidentalis]|uniref:Ankyrin-2 isoform X23 n=1 Tax=Frankliniella occidentalis TaxID=133901 RepID=A0A9C6WY51_FRAOC|nr:ankyrin-2 isoform X23 [Frankliniella occidentalis]